MSRHKKQTPIILPVYMDENNKATFGPYHLEKVEEVNDKGENVVSAKLVTNERAKNKFGENYDKPMNRAARRLQSRKHRLYVKRYGQKVLVETVDLESKKDD